MTQATPGNPSLYFEINCQEWNNCINARYSCSRVGCVGWLVEQEALSVGVGHAQAYIWSRAMPGTSASSQCFMLITCGFAFMLEPHYLHHATETIFRREANRQRRRFTRDCRQVSWTSGYSFWIWLRHRKHGCLWHERPQGRCLTWWVTNFILLIGVMTAFFNLWKVKCFIVIFGQSYSFPEYHILLWEKIFVQTELNFLLKIILYNT